MDIVINAGDSLSPVALFRIVIVGNSDIGRLMDFIDEIENYLIKK